MSEAIGPGSAVIKVSGAPRIPNGTVAFVLAVVPAALGHCRTCGSGIRSGLILSIPNEPGFDDWCPNHWRPYQGPEQAKREVSEREPA